MKTNIKNICLCGLFLIITMGCSTKSITENSLYCNNDVGFLNWDGFKVQQTLFNDANYRVVEYPENIKKMTVTVNKTKLDPNTYSDYYTNPVEHSKYEASYENRNPTKIISDHYETYVYTFEYDENKLLIKYTTSLYGDILKQIRYEYEIDGNNIKRTSYIGDKIVKILTQEKVENGYVLHSKYLRTILDTEELIDEKDSHLFFDKKGNLIEYQNGDYIFNFFYENNVLKKVEKYILSYYNWKKYKKSKLHDYDLIYCNGILTEEKRLSYVPKTGERDESEDTFIKFEDYDEYGNWTLAKKSTEFYEQDIKREFEYIE